MNWKTDNQNDIHFNYVNILQIKLKTETAPDSYRDRKLNYSSTGSTMVSMASASLKSFSVTPLALCVESEMVNTLYTLVQSG